MEFREVTLADIGQMQVVRNSVKENVLSDPELVPDSAYEEFILGRGKGWVCKDKGRVIGFAFVDMREENIWALFVHPDYEGKGIGRQLHDTMLDWYFLQGKQRVWLGTSPNTRAETFYHKQGWKECGMHGKGEIKFEMQSSDWLLKAIQ